MLFFPLALSFIITQLLRWIKNCVLINKNKSIKIKSYFTYFLVIILWIFNLCFIYVGRKNNRYQGVLVVNNDFDYHSFQSSVVP